MVQPFEAFVRDSFVLRTTKHSTIFAAGTWILSVQPTPT